MLLKYETPVAEILSFLALEKLATDDGDRTRSTSDDNTVTIPGSMGFVEDVEDW